MDELPIYLDYNATTPVAPEILDAMLPFLRDGFGNPSSRHAHGRRARDAVRTAREQVAAAIGAQPSEIVFTSGGTEGNNMVVRGIAEVRPRGRHLVTSRIEHPSVADPCRRLERAGWRIDRLEVDEHGRVRTDRMDVGEQTALVSVMLANNETGTIQPIRKLADSARAAGAVMHTDAAQALGKIPVDVGALGVDLLTLVGHKAYAPKGVGALYVREGIEIAPLLLGGGQESARRAGTENVPSIVAIGAAFELVTAHLEDEAARQRRLSGALFEALRERIPGVARNAPANVTLPNTLSVRFPGVLGSAVLAAAPSVAASTGSACHEGGETASAVLSAMGLDPSAALGTVRLSVGRGTTEAHIEAAAEALVEAFEISTR